MTHEIQPQDTQEELKPCPFCGCTEIEYENDVGPDDDYYVSWYECKNCGGKAETINSWNTRTPSFDLIPHLIRQREWSAKTFGEHGDRTVGLIKHIQKELEEIRQDPRDLMEWIDVVILAFDGAWRAGYTAEEIAAALDRKQQINMARAWPDISSANLAEPIEHIGG